MNFKDEKTFISLHGNYFILFSKYNLIWKRSFERFNTDKFICTSFNLIALQLYSFSRLTRFTEGPLSLSS